MAKTAIANPTIILGLDSSQLTKGLSGAVSVAGSFGKKIGETLSAAIMAPMNALKIGAAISTPLNQAMELMGKANTILGAPVRALMAREADQAAAAGMPIANATSSTMTGVMARFVFEIEELAADLVVGLDRAFNFRAILEGFRGVASGVRSLLVAAFGPLIAVANDKQALDAAFAAGQQIAVEGFKMIAEGLIDVAANIIDLSNTVIKFFNSLMGIMPFSAKQEEAIKDWQNANQQWVPGLGGGPVGGFGGINPNVGQGRFIPGNREDAIKALGLNQEQDLLPGINVGAAKQGIANIIAGFKPAAPEPARMAENELRNFITTLGDARTPLQDLALQMQQFQANADAMRNAVNAMPAGQEQLAAAARYNQMIERGEILLGQRLQGILSPTMQSMEAGRITSAADVGSAALVEAIVRASAQSAGGDIQQQIKSAIEMQLAQQEAQTKIQRAILEAARNGGLVGLGKI
jgi:hypothetical protein